MGHKLRLGFVGAGFIAAFHAKAIKSIRGIDIEGIVSPNSAGDFSEMVRREDLGKGRIFPTVFEMAKHVDAILISNPNYMRLETINEIVDSVKQGAELKGVLCEKPLARNVKEGRMMVERVREAGLKTAYLENQVFMKPLKVQRIQLEPQIETMGPLCLVRSAEEHAGPHKSWFWDPVLQGGGVLSDMGCHSIAAAWYALTPPRKELTFLQPVSVQCDCSLLKWNQPRWRKALMELHGVDYSETPAEDFTTGVVTFQNPETKQFVKAQFTNSWMFEKQGLRILMDGMGPGYAFEFNTLKSSLEVFIDDTAAEAVADAETALEKATASRGLLPVQYNEADLYGYTDELEDAAKSLLSGKDGYLPFEYGLEITKLVMAAYMASERSQTIDLADREIQDELETFIPKIQQGRGAEVLQHT